MGLGALLIVAGLIGWIGSLGAEPASAQPAATSTTDPGGDPQAATQPTTTTSTPAPTTTSIPNTTSTSVPDATLIELFVPTFATTIAAGDADALLMTLHPAVIAVHDEQTCLAFINSEILLLESYQLTGPVSGPTTQTIESFTIDMYTAPIAFTFQGQEFEATASFAVEDGTVLWFGECAPN